MAFVSCKLFADLPNPLIPGISNSMLVYGAATGGVVLVLLVLLRLVRRTKPADPETGLSENLGTFPPPPRGHRHYQLLVMNQRVRVRLVVIAPVGKKPIGKPDSVLEQVFRGLGEVALDDHPRMRLWPPQLSTAGFAPTFFRLTRRPDPEGKPSRWILLAGPARAGAIPVLLGMAVLADEASKLGLLTMDETQWAEVLRVEHA